MTDQHVLAVWQAIEETGRLVTLARIGGPSVAIRAVIRKYDAKELVEPLIQGDRKMFISNIPLANASWPIPPRKNDRVSMGQEEFTVVNAEPVRHKGEVAKWRVSIRGGRVA